MAGKKPVQNTFKANEVLGERFRQGSFMYCPVWEGSGLYLNTIGTINNSNTVFKIGNAFSGTDTPGGTWVDGTYGLNFEKDGADRYTSGFHDSQVFDSSSYDGYGTMMVSFQYNGNNGTVGGGFSGESLLSVGEQISSTLGQIFARFDLDSLIFLWVRNFGSYAISVPNFWSNLSIGNFYTIVCRAHSGGKEIWMNGELLASDNLPFTRNVSASANTFIVTPSGGGALNDNTPWYAHGMWDGSLSSRDAKELSIDPFLPLRSKYYPVDAAGDYLTNVYFSLSRYLSSTAASSKMPTCRLYRPTTGDTMDFYPDTNYPTEGHLINTVGQSPKEWMEADSSTYLLIDRVYNQANTSLANYFSPTGNRAPYVDKDIQYTNRDTDSTAALMGQRPSGLVVESADNPAAVGVDEYQLNAAVSEVGADGITCAGVLATFNYTTGFTANGSLFQNDGGYAQFSVNPNTDTIYRRTSSFGNFEESNPIPEGVAASTNYSAGFVMGTFTDGVSSYYAKFNGNKYLEDNAARIDIADEFEQPFLGARDSFSNSGGSFSEVILWHTVLLEDDLDRYLQNVDDYFRTPKARSPDGIGALSLQRTSSSIGIVYNGD